MLAAVAEFVAVHIIRICALRRVVSKIGSTMFLGDVPVWWDLIQHLFNLIFQLIGLVANARRLSSRWWRNESMLGALHVLTLDELLLRFLSALSKKA